MKKTLISLIAVAGLALGCASSVKVETDIIPKQKSRFSYSYESYSERKSDKKHYIKGLETRLRRLDKWIEEELEQDYLSHDGCYDGWFVLETNDEKMTAEQALKHYKDKDAVEKLICTLKQDCKLRPFNVRKDACIRGSLFISMLASLVIGIFHFMQKSHLGKMSTRSLVDKMKTLTLDLVYGTTGRIIEQALKNVTTLFAKLFPQLQTLLIDKTKTCPLLLPSQATPGKKTAKKIQPTQIKLRPTAQTPKNTRHRGRKPSTHLKK